MTQSSNIPAIEKTTKLPWIKWLAYLEAAEAKTLAHRQIADLAYAKLENKLKNAGWWAQAVTVAYEQHIGRRQPGQRSDGTYEFSLTKTFAASMDEIMRAWLGWVKNKKDFNGVAIAKPPTTSQTDKRRHWACNLADGTRLNADVNPTALGKVILAITHQKIPSQDESDQWRLYWKAVLVEL